MRAAVSGATLCGSRMKRDTVMRVTPAASATWCKVGRPWPRRCRLGTLEVITTRVFADGSNLPLPLMLPVTRNATEVLSDDSITRQSPQPPLVCRCRHARFRAPAAHPADGLAARRRARAADRRDRQYL